MYPVSGGTARFPHYAFGGVAGASFGWFAWLQAATVAPIEVSAMILYAGHYSFAKDWLHTDGRTLTARGLVVAIMLMALVSAVNFLGIRHAGAHQQRGDLVEGRGAAADDLRRGIAGFHGGNLTAADGFSPVRRQGHPAPPSRPAASSSRYLGFEQADQLAGESKNPKRDIPVAVIGSIVIGLIIYIVLQVVFIAGAAGQRDRRTWAERKRPLHRVHRAVGASWPPWSASAGWPHPVPRRDHLPGGTGLIYTTAPRGSPTA